MIQYDERLNDLQAKVSRRGKLEGQLAQLEEQQRRLSQQVQELDSVRIREQADVDKLEGRSLAAFFYNVIGKMDERLDKEREEAYAAAVRYDLAARELEQVEYDLNKVAAEYNSLSGCEAAYLRAMKEKSDALKESDIPAGQEILRLEEQLAQTNSLLREAREAVSAGKIAQRAAADAGERLEHARELATWDMLGGGLLVDLAKHDALDEAQRDVEELQSCLRRFHNELADVKLASDLTVKMDDFTRFADYFFDNLFMDWSVANKIDRSKEQIRDVKSQLEAAMNRLKALQKHTEDNARRLQAQIDQLVLETRM